MDNISIDYRSGKSHEMGDPKGADMKPPRGFFAPLEVVPKKDAAQGFYDLP